ncbi:hypothetical protein BJX76DRAFT_360674 [Aspergillus varians]
MPPKHAKSDKLYWHGVLEKVGNDLANPPPDTSDSDSESSDTVDEIFTSIERIKQLVPESEPEPEPEAQAQAQPKPQDQVPEPPIPPKPCYDIFIGVPRPPYLDNQCECELIIHNRETKLCKWLYAVALEDDSIEGSTTHKKEHVCWPRQQDHELMCCTMTDKAGVGVLRAGDYEKFVGVYESVEPRQSVTFVFCVLRACVEGGMLSGGRVVDALKDLGLWAQAEVEVEGFFKGVE